jgi:hypothetical protein
MLVCHAVLKEDFRMVKVPVIFTSGRNWGICASFLAYAASLDYLALQRCQVERKTFLR